MAAVISSFALILLPPLLGVVIKWNAMEKALQVGTPEELYMNPKSIFAAHFIGESYFLEGYISELNDKTATIELRGGLKVKATNKGIKEGEKVILTIRPETFTIEKEVKKVETPLWA